MVPQHRARGASPGWQGTRVPSKGMGHGIVGMGKSGNDDVTDGSRDLRQSPGSGRARPFPSSRQGSALSCRALGWEPGEEGGSLCYTDHCSNTSTTLDRLQHGIIGLQGLDIKTNQRRNSLQLCTMRGNLSGVAGSMYMSVDWHSGDHSSGVFAHEDHAAKPWALPVRIFSTDSPGTARDRGSKRQSSHGWRPFGHTWSQQRRAAGKYLSCCLF